MGREGRDEIGAVGESSGHVEEALREHREFGGAVMLERPQSVAVARPDRIRPRDQLLDRPRDRAVEGEPDQQCQHRDGEACRRNLALLLVEMAKDVARRARGVEHGSDAPVAHDRHGRENPHAGAAAQRVDRRRLVLGDPQAQHRGEAPVQRLCHLLDMGERLAELTAPGDDDALRIEQAETSERDVLRRDEKRFEPRAGSAIGLACRRCSDLRIGSARQQPVPGQIQRRQQRRKLFVAIPPSLRGNLRSQHRPGRQMGLQILLDRRGQGRTLGDQLRFRLMHELVLVDAEEEQADEGQCQHRRQHHEHHQAQARPPLGLDPDRRRALPAHAAASQRPSLKPTPCTVSIALSQPALASFARMLRIWLSIVRSATWIAPP